MGVALSDETCKFLMAIIAQDLGISDRLADLRGGNSDFFSCAPSDAVLSVSTGLYELFESLVSIVPDADTYFSCLQHFTKAG